VLSFRFDIFVLLPFVRNHTSFRAITGGQVRVALVYMKIVTEGTAHHLCLIDELSNESKTLCGRTVPQYHSWKRIRSLEGDECPQYSRLAVTPEHPQRLGTKPARDRAGRPEAERVRLSVGGLTRSAALLDYCCVGVYELAYLFILLASLS
jgi:hypothetical protein